VPPHVRIDHEVGRIDDPEHLRAAAVEYLHAKLVGIPSGWSDVDGHIPAFRRKERDSSDHVRDVDLLAAEDVVARLLLGGARYRGEKERGEYERDRE